MGPPSQRPIKAQSTRKEARQSTQATRKRKIARSCGRCDRRQLRRARSPSASSSGTDPSSVPTRRWRLAASTRPMRSAACCGCRTSSASAARTSPATSTSMATSSTSSTRSATPSRRSAAGSGVARAAGRAGAAEAGRRARRAAAAAAGGGAACTGWRHSLRRDAQAIGHHYDVGNDFYRLVLGPSMTYSCARFATPTPRSRRRRRPSTSSICRKLGLARAARRAAARRRLRLGLDGHPRRRALRRARRRHHHQRGAGRAGSAARRGSRRRRSRRDPPAGLSRPRRRAVRRDLARSACSSTSATRKLDRVLRRRCASLLVPQGRLLNHAISSVGGSHARPRTSFIGRYVFPDGELHRRRRGRAGHGARPASRSATSSRCASTTPARCGAGWRTSRRNWDEAVKLVGEPRARDLAAVHGRLGGRLRGRRDRDPPGARRGAHGSGNAGMPTTRRDWG